MLRLILVGGAGSGPAYRRDLLDRGGKRRGWCREQDLDIVVGDGRHGTIEWNNLNPGAGGGKGDLELVGVPFGHRVGQGGDLLRRVIAVAGESRHELDLDATRVGSAEHLQVELEGIGFPGGEAEGGEGHRDIVVGNEHAPAAAGCIDDCVPIRVATTGRIADARAAGKERPVGAARLEAAVRNDWNGL